MQKLEEKSRSITVGRGFTPCFVAGKLWLDDTDGMSLAKVLVVEDDSFARSLLSSVLSAADFEVKTASSAEEALQILDSFAPRVSLLDVDLGLGPTGVDIAHALRARDPSIGIVFLTSFKDYRLSRAGSLTLPKGARYLNKTEFDQTEKLTTELLSASIRPLVNEKRSRLALPLTTHQIEIMRMVANGFTNQQIAIKQESSEKAIEHVLSRILKRLGIARNPRLNPRVQLVQAYAEFSGRALPK